MMLQQEHAWNQILEENARLRSDLAALQREHTDLKLLMETNIEHSDFVEDELLYTIDTTKKRLLTEIVGLRREIAALHQRIGELQQQRADLELLIQMNLEHSNYIEEDLLNKVESTLRESERRFRLISETIPLPILISRLADNTIVYTNHFASIYLVSPMPPLLGRRLTEFYAPVDCERVMEHVMTQGALSQYELFVHCEDQTSRWAALSAHPLTFNNEPCLLTVLYDLTARKQDEEKIRELNEALEYRVQERTAELQAMNIALQKSLETVQLTQEHLIHAEKMAALGSLVSGVAHELNTPLGVGVTAISYLQQQTLNIEEQYTRAQMSKHDFERYLENAHKSLIIALESLQRAAEQVKSFKQVAVDHTSAEKRRFNLKHYLDNLLLSLHSKFKSTHHRVSIQCPDNLEILSYPGAFSQILTNFILNSLMHGFETFSRGQIMIQMTRHADFLTLCYQDNGRGMGDHERSRMFDPFYTTKRGQGGTGLGLHIVYNLVTQQLQGTIECRSAPGKGTTFVLQIPLEPDDIGGQVET